MYVYTYLHTVHVCYICTVVKTCKYTVTVVGIHTNVQTYTYSTLLGLETSNKSAPLRHAFLKETLQLIILVPVEYLSFLLRYRLGAAVQNVQHTMDLRTYVRT